MHSCPGEANWPCSSHFVVQTLGPTIKKGHCHIDGGFLADDLATFRHLTPRMLLAPLTLNRFGAKQRHKRGGGNDTWSES